jgi:hypothetical protein
MTFYQLEQILQSIFGGLKDPNPISEFVVICEVILN